MMEKLRSGEMIEWEDLDKKRYYVIGPSLFFFVRAVIYPFNFIKTRLFMQQQNQLYNGTFDAFRKVVRYEGVRALYKGFNVSILGLAAGQLYITTYELSRSQLSGYSTELKGLISGGLATCVGQTVTVPIDILSQHLMMDGQATTTQTPGASKLKPPYIVVKNVDYVINRQAEIKLRTGISVAREIVSREGLKGLYRGYGVSLLAYAPNSALWWSCYGGFYKLNAERGLTSVLPIPLVQMYCGVLSAVVASVLTNPLDVIRTRYQVCGGVAFLGPTLIHVKPHTHTRS